LLANGSLHLHRLANDPVENVVEPVMIRAPQGAPWSHVGTLMKVLANPSVVFWKVEIASDPAPEPVPARLPR
jgi:hypothetical protein